MISLFTFRGLQLKTNPSRGVEYCVLPFSPQEDYTGERKRDVSHTRQELEGRKKTKYTRRHDVKRAQNKRTNVSKIKEKNFDCSSSRKIHKLWRKILKNQSKIDEDFTYLLLKWRKRESKKRLLHQEREEKQTVVYVTRSPQVNRLLPTFLCQLCPEVPDLP